MNKMKKYIKDFRSMMESSVFCSMYIDLWYIARNDVSRTDLNYNKCNMLLVGMMLQFIFNFIKFYL